jgi:hypothetical protein
MESLSFLLELAVITLWVVGIRIATGEGMILERVDAALWGFLPRWIYKPIIGCAYCMSSIHGALIHFVIFKGGLLYAPLVIVCSVPLIGIVINLHDKIRE